MPVRNDLDVFRWWPADRRRSKRLNPFGIELLALYGKIGNIMSFPPSLEQDLYTARQFARRIGSSAAVIVMFAGAAFAQSTAKLPGIVVGESPRGIKLRLSNGAVSNPRVLRLSKPDRLVLDFDNAAIYQSAAELQRWQSLGVRMAFHAEDNSTRVVFDIPSGQQRWMQREGDSLIVAYESTAKGAAPTVVAERAPQAAAVLKVPPRSMRTGRASTAPPSAQQIAVAVAKSAPATHLEVISQNGLLQVSARGVSFQAILTEVASSTGASLQQMTPIDTGQTEVFEYGPAPPMEVIRKLFEGSHYNYVLVSEPNSTTRISRIVVTSTLRLLPGNDGPVTDDDTNPESLQGIAPIPQQSIPVPMPDPQDNPPN